MTTPHHTTDHTSRRIKQVISALRDYADAFNERRYRPELIGVSVTDTHLRTLSDGTLDPATAHVTVSIWNGETREDFRVRDQNGHAVLQGRGATFRANRTGVGLAISTALGTRTLTEEADGRNETLGLDVQLRARGFSVRKGEYDNLDHEQMICLIHATHPDGTRLWFTLRNLHFGEAIDVHFGETHLAAFERGYDIETARDMAAAYAQPDTSHPDFTPDAVTPRRWTVQQEALDALIAHARTHPGTPIDDDTVPGRVPADFDAPGNTDHQVPERTFTRAQARREYLEFLAQQATTRAAQPAGPKDPLPF